LTSNICPLRPDLPESLAVVGSRKIPSAARRFATEVGRLAGGSGLSLFSGNAVGSDEAAMRGAVSAGGRVVGILPHGIRRLEREIEGVEYWSLCPPDEEFSRAAAMERNALIYAAAPFSVVVHARLREGGTWHGAIDAHRRRLTQLIARQAPDEPGNQALLALGAIALADPGSLFEAFHAQGAQAPLF
jgi:predicted Rossmann fold nucleotide-binding protein DprA/Smf involved in DNA uptake